MLDKTRTKSRRLPKELQAAADAAGVEIGKPDETIVQPVRMEVLRVTIEGIEPLVLHRFVQKTTKGLMDKMLQTEQEQTQQARTKKKVRPPRDFEGDFKAATYRAKEGWAGLPCRHLRAATIGAARTDRALAMTTLKRSIFITPQGRDAIEPDIPLVKLSTEPRMHIGPGRNSGIGKTIDLRSRPMWDTWSATFDIEFDVDAISVVSLTNLLHRAGKQIGIGEGRPDSRMSYGCDWGRFKVIKTEHIVAKEGA